MQTKLFEIWKQRAKQLKLEVHAIYLAYRDPRTPWYAKLFIGCVVVYALSPIDLIIIPLGVAIALKMIPQGVLADCREKVHQTAGQTKPTIWIGVIAIIAVWIIFAVVVVIFFLRLWKI